MNELQTPLEREELKADRLLLDVRNLKTYFDTEHGIVKAVDGVDLTVHQREILGLVGESGCGKSVTSLSIMRLVRKPGRIIDGTIDFAGTSIRDLPDDKMIDIRGNHLSMIFQQPQSSLNPAYKVGQQVAEVLQLHPQILQRRNLNKNKSWDEAVAMLRRVGISDAEQRANAYPHELSGGMAQRVMIATALICSPELLIADEPTTALDVTIQAQILDLLREVRNQMNTAIILITHDMGVIAETADRVAVMYAGRIVEEADVKSLFANPLHPYTQGLLNSIPILGQTKEKLAVIPGSVPNLIDMEPGCRFAARCQARTKYGLSVCSEVEPELRPVGGANGANHKVRCWLYHDSDRHVAPLSVDNVISAAPTVSNGLPQREATETNATTALHIQESIVSPAAKVPNGRQDLLQIVDLVKHFPVRGRLLQRSRSWVRAVDNISFTIRKGETLGLVGESGCGKTTVGRTILGLIPATAGSVTFEDRDIFAANRHELKRLRRDMQLIFQDPFSSLDPRMRVGESITVGLRVHGMQNAGERREVAAKLLRKVGLEEYHARRYPHEFSGGQRQRIGIARALALQPKFIVCDEPVSALDVSIQSQVLNLLRDLQRDFDLTYLFIAHDLSVVEHISDRVAVMYLGKLVELADRDELYRRPLHPYTQALMSAIPIPDPVLKRERLLLEGEVPSAQNPPSGCRFHPRCPYATEICVTAEPEFRDLGSAGSPHLVACHHAEQFL